MISRRTLFAASGVVGVTILVGCSSGADGFSGTYKGPNDQGTLVLNKGGTGFITIVPVWTGRVVGAGSSAPLTWVIEDGYIVVTTSLVDYKVRAATRNAHDALLFEGPPGSGWTPWLYTKV